jgi:alpha-tubulin suppressor-like RCC1 family protein
VPQVVPTLANASHVFCGTQSACVIHSGGSLVCRGMLSPSGETNVIAGAAFMWMTCAASQDGTVNCWGDNHGGLLGSQTYVPLPTPVPDLQSAVGIVLGTSHACGRWADGNVVCMGNYENVAPPFGPARTIAGLGTVTQLVSGDGFVCALQNGGRVSCWGQGMGRFDQAAPYASSDVPLDILY